MTRRSVADVIDRARAELRRLGTGRSGAAQFHLVPAARRPAPRPVWRAADTTRSSP
jgi:hypothetical protein